MSERAAEPDVVQASYESPDPLRARQAIYAYSDRPSDFVGWALGHAGDVSGRVLDVGCGPAAYLDRLPTAVGVDLSFGMAQAAPQGRVAVADAAALPFPDDCFDVVLAMHMMYHVPSIGRVAAELARVAHADAVILLATNGSGHLRAFRQLLVAATGVEALPPAPAARFNLDSGPSQLAAALEVVDVQVDRQQLVVDDANAVVAYVDSVRALYEVSLPAGTSWTQVVDRARGFVEAQIEELGAWTAESEGGVIVAKPRR